MPDFKTVSDSGVRLKFATGAVRDTAVRKGRYDLITPLGLQRLARHYENGAVKYSDRNWEKGMKIGRCLDSAVRHAFSYLRNRILGRPQDEDHLAAIAWNALAAIHFEELIASGALPAALDDLPNPPQKEGLTDARATARRSAKRTSATGPGSKVPRRARRASRTG